MTKNWSLLSATAYGALGGLVVGLWQLMTDAAHATDMTGNLGRIGAAILGGAILFFLLTGIRNRIFTAR